MRKYYIIQTVLTLSSMLLLHGCIRKSQSAGITDKELTVQVMKGSEDSVLIYNVRVFPNREILEADKTIGQKMTYDADSCFYLLNEQQKLYPTSIESIANGVRSSFEYVIRFEDVTTKLLSEPVILFYQDKYINRKNYQLVLK